MPENTTEPQPLLSRYRRVRHVVKAAHKGALERGAKKEEAKIFRKGAFFAAEEQQKVIESNQQEAQRREEDVLRLVKEKQGELERTGKALVESQTKLRDTETAKQEAEKLSRIDPLTGLLNRRGMDKKITEAISRVKREEERIFKTTGEKPPEKKFAVFYLDLNNLGQINKLSKDLHTAGDVILKALAQALSIGERSVDIIARIGGDEFAIILESTDLEGALKYWARKDKQIQAQNELVNGVGSVWVSAGVAEATVDTFEEKLKVADQALSLAKKESKSRVDRINVIKTEKDIASN